MKCELLFLNLHCGLSLTLLLVYNLDLADSLFFFKRSDHLDGKIECGGGMLDYFMYLVSSVQFML